MISIVIRSGKTGREKKKLEERSETQPLRKKKQDSTNQCDHSVVKTFRHTHK